MTFTVRGIVTSGFGRGKKFVAMEGYAHQFERELGYEPHPGTLNLELDAPVRERLARLDPTRLDGWEADDRSFGAVDCYPAVVPGSTDSVPLHFVLPHRTDYDTSTIELISPVNLRERFGLSDGTAFEIRIQSGGTEV
nr:CTP-dependent riboflavin kinase [Haladaptatus sp. DYF46]